ncbi:hypothetical protein [Roseibium sp.]|uniref:hypothetical protein n=1 Tax=Roseibium sp. TaxID=1936156 RepID=UPI003BAF8915
MLKHVLAVLAALAALTTSASACGAPRHHDLRDALRSEAVFVGKLLDDRVDVTRYSTGAETQTHKLVFEITDILSGRLTGPDRFLIEYSTDKRIKPLKRGTSYVAVLSETGITKSTGARSARNYVKRSFCTTYAPLIFEEKSEAGRALKMMFQDDGIPLEAKAEILSRFVGLYGQGRLF